jgi:hypothetical protein
MNKGKDKKKGRMVIKHHNRLLGITVLIWLLIGLMFWLVDPENVKDLVIKESYLLPGVLLYAGLYFLSSILTLSARRAFLWTSLLMTIIYLRIFRLASYFNLILILGMAGSVEVYWWQNRNK